MCEQHNDHMQPPSTWWTTYYGSILTSNQFTPLGQVYLSGGVLIQQPQGSGFSPQLPTVGAVGKQDPYLHDCHFKSVNLCLFGHIVFPDSKMHFP